MSDNLKLSNGKEVYANCGIVGLAPKPENDEIWMPSEGYDGGFPTPTFSPFYEAGESSAEITKFEMLEVCDIMITRWKEYKNYILAQKES